MDHPFFNAPNFPSHRPEAQELLSLLVSHADDGNRIKQLYRETHPSPRTLNLTLGGDLIWAEALQSLTADGFLEIFLNRMALHLTNQPFSLVIQKIKKARPDHQRRVLPGGMLVFDRNPLRDLISNLAKEDIALKVLVLHGGDGTGKSHCRYIFEASARANGGEPFYFCDPIVSTLDDILQVLFSRFQATDRIPARHTSSAAWHKQVILKLSELAVGANIVLWIAVDDLAKAESGYFLDPDIRGFFDQLSLLLLAPQFMKSFRLMLIQYPENLPTKWNAETYEVCPISIEDINKNDVTELLREHITAKGKQLHDSAIELMAESIIQESGDRADGEWLSRLYNITKVRLRTI